MQNGKDSIKNAEEYQPIIDSIKKIGEDIDNCWKSNNKTIFLEELNKFIEDAQNDINYISLYGKTILEINENFQNKDKEYGQQIKDNELEENKNYETR